MFVHRKCSEETTANLTLLARSRHLPAEYVKYLLGAKVIRTVGGGKRGRKHYLSNANNPPTMAMAEKFQAKYNKLRAENRLNNNSTWKQKVELLQKKNDRYAEVLAQVAKGQNGELKGDFISRVTSMAKKALEA